MDPFKFRIEQWYAAVQPVPLPADADIVLLLDPAPTANQQSDESAFACGYLSAADGLNDVLTVLDMAASKWKGGLLADKALNLIERWHPVKFSYENNPGLDWFADLLRLKAGTRGITVPRIDPFTPHNGKQAKEKRIRRLQDLFDREPPAIVFQEGSYFSKLFEQVKNFEIGGDKRGRENGLIDALAMLAFPQVQVAGLQ